MYADGTTSKVPDHKKSGMKGEVLTGHEEPAIGIPKPPQPEPVKDKPKPSSNSGITNTNTNTVTGGNTEISIGNVGSGARSEAKEKAQEYLKEKDKEDEQIADSNEPTVTDNEGPPNPNYEPPTPGKPGPGNVTQQPAPGNATYQPGYGERIGQPGAGTMDFQDSDGDRVDDRYQAGPGQERIYNSFSKNKLGRTPDKENNNPFTNYRDVFDSGKRTAKRKNQSKGYNFNKGGYDYR